MNKYNLDKLVKVSCCDFLPSCEYEYKSEKKLFGITIQREGFYGWIGYEGKDTPKYCKLIDGDVFDVPEVELHYQDGYSKVYYFESYDEAKMFVGKITAIGRWIE